MFTPEEEEELAEHISKFAQSGFPFTTIEIWDWVLNMPKSGALKGFLA